MMKTSTVNLVIKKYFKENKIKLGEVAELLDISQSNLTERLNSTRAITIDEFMILYGQYGDNFGLSIMSHYGAKMLYLEKIRILISHMSELKNLYGMVRATSEDIFDLLDEIESGMNEIYSDR
jgi:plasmid maintenance system antidote protein VapI